MEQGSNPGVVLDSSMSMIAFRGPMEKSLMEKLESLAGAAAKTDWRLMESDPTRAALYSGPDIAGVRAALANWQPHLGTHDFSPSWRIAQSLVRNDGVVLFVSDRAVETPAGIKLLSVGEPFDNCCFAGLRIERVIPVLPLLSEVWVVVLRTLPRPS